MKILTIVSVYLPGSESGGPIRSIASVVARLGDNFDFWILTGDRDKNDSEPYPNVPKEKWVSVGKALVYYTDVNSLSLYKLRKLIKGLEPDIVYLNSFFSQQSNKYLLLRWLNMIPQIPTVVAPRGVFSPGALQLKRFKKYVFLQVAQRTRLFNGFYWQASSKVEKRYILASLPAVAESDVFVAPNLVESIANNFGPTEIRDDLAKEPGHARFIFLSRIAVMKNLEYALTLLQNLDSFIDFGIYGPIEDPSYWNRCLRIIADLPDNVTVHYHGAVPHENVGKVLRQGHFLLLPTRGENFGHVIFEALQSGCPVLISDRTPWNDLPDVKAGWVAPLQNYEQWFETLQYCIDMDQDDYACYSSNAKKYAMQFLSSPGALQANENMFLATYAREESSH